jgi:transglutaminase-like putative cysteine protease
MRKLLVFLLILLIASYADVVDMSDGRLISGSNLEYRNGKLLLDGKAFDRSEISRITLGTKRYAPIGEQAGQGFSEILSDIDYLFEQAEIVEEKYPDASGIVIVDHGTYKLNLDGTRSYSYHFAGRILDQSTLGWGHRPLWFEEGRSGAKILFARVISPEGEIAWWDTSDYVITEPSEGGVFFDYGKILSAAFPEVGIGSIVEYAYETTTYNPFDPNFFSAGFYFQDEVPTVKSHCTVVVPIGKDLNFKNYNWPKDNNSPKITRDENFITYDWLIENTTPFLNEPKAPSYADLVPHFNASLFHDWNYIYDWLGGLNSARMVATDEIKAKVAEITDCAIDMADSIGRIYIWVQREIHYISIKGSVASGQTGHEAQFTFEKKYGDCTDKSILLSTMLREIGVEAYPIIIMTNDEEEIPRDIPGFDGNHAITLIYYDGEEIFLDPTSTTHKFPYYRSDDVGVTYVCALCRRWGMTSTPPPEENARHIDIKAFIDEKGNMTANYTAGFIGNYEADFRGFWEMQPVERRGIILQNWMSYTISGAEVVSWELPGADDLSVPFREEMKLRVESYPSFAGDLWLVKVPEIENILVFDEVSLKERKFPIEYTAPYRESFHVEFEFPQNIVIEALPEDIEIESEYAYFKANYRETQKGVLFEGVYDLKARIIPPEDYRDYQTFCRKISRYIQNQIFLRKET